MESRVYTTIDTFMHPLLIFFLDIAVNSKTANNENHSFQRSRLVHLSESRVSLVISRDWLPRGATQYSIARGTVKYVFFHDSHIKSFKAAYTSRWKKKQFHMSVLLEHSWTPRDLHTDAFFLRIVDKVVVACCPVNISGYEFLCRAEELWSPCSFKYETLL